MAKYNFLVIVVYLASRPVCTPRDYDKPFLEYFLWLIFFLKNWRVIVISAAHLAGFKIRLRYSVYWFGTPLVLLISIFFIADWSYLWLHDLHFPDRTNGPIRLLRPGGSSTSYTSGRVLVYYNSTWGNICDDQFENFGSNEANVICHQLGYTGASSWSKSRDDS